MTNEGLLDSLKLAISSDEKAALVAEAVIKDLPENIARVAIRCSFLPWFSEEIISSLLGTGNFEDIKTVIDLPFVETISLGYCFHPSARMGLIKKYLHENPLEIEETFRNSEQAFIKLSESRIPAAIALLYGYVITNQGQKAEHQLVQMLESGRINSIEDFSELDEAESYCIDSNNTLTPKYWLYKAQIYLAIGNFEKLERACNNALNIDSNYHLAYSMRGLAKAFRGDYVNALSDANTAVEIKADEISYRVRGVIHVLKGDLKNGMFDYTRAIRVDSGDFLSYIGRARAYLLLNKPQKSKIDLENAIRVSRDPQTLSVVHSEYAAMLVLENKLEEAIEHLNYAIQNSSSSGLFRRKGDAHLRLNELDRANECFESAINLDSENPYAYLGIGKIHLMLRDYTNALNDFYKAHSFKEHSAALTYADSLFGLHEIDLRIWETFIRLGDEQKANEQRDSLLSIEHSARQLIELMLFSREYRQFESLLKISELFIRKNYEGTGSIPGYISAAYALNSLNRHHEALEYLEKYSQNSILDYINIAMAHWGLREFTNSIEHFENANLLLPGHKYKKTSKEQISGARKAWITLMLGNSHKAIKDVNDYLKSSPDKDELYDLRDWIAIIARSNNIPEGLQEFSTIVANGIDDLDKNSIFVLTPIRIDEVRSVLYTKKHFNI